MPDQEQEPLWAELATRPDVTLAQVLAVGRMPDGRLVWLERGNERAGWVHIISEHDADFRRRGIIEAQLVYFLMAAVCTGKIVGRQGTRAVYQVIFNGQEQFVSITIGINGFIVGANPTPTRLIQKIKGVHS